MVTEVNPLDVVYGQFVNGLDADGNLLTSSVDFSSLSFQGLFGNPAYSIIPPALANCLPCKYAPVAFFLLADFMISMYGLSNESRWLCLQLLTGAFYVRSSAYQEGRYLEKSDKQTRISTIMLSLMAGITLRNIGMHYMLS